MQSLQASFYQLVCFESKYQATYLRVRGSGSHGLETERPPTSIERSQCLRFSPFGSSSSIIQSMVFDTAFLTSDHWWGHKRSSTWTFWIFSWTNLSNLLAVELASLAPLKEVSSRSHAWRLSSVLPERLAFREMLQRLSLQTSGFTAKLIRKTVLDSSIGVIDGI